MPLSNFTSAESNSNCRAGKWPDNVEAFKKMKAAIGIQIGEELFTNVGLRADASEECLDVFADGFAFRLYIFSERSGFSSKLVRLMRTLLPVTLSLPSHCRSNTPRFRLISWLTPCVLLDETKLVQQKMQCPAGTVQ